MHCHDEKQESKVCSSCETLHQMLDQVNREKASLLESLLESTRPREIETIKIPENNIEPLRPPHVSWRIKQQMLESEDRERAKLLSKKMQEIKESKIDVSDLEAELDLVKQEKNNAS